MLNERQNADSHHQKKVAPGYQTGSKKKKQKKENKVAPASRTDES
jgi:hypothetical protein